MNATGSKCSPIVVNEMLESIQQKAKEESIPMNTYLTAELNIPEDEAPLLRKALSYLDTLNNPASGMNNKGNENPSNGGLKQNVSNAPQDPVEVPNTTNASASNSSANNPSANNSSASNSSANNSSASNSSASNSSANNSSASNSSGSNSSASNSSASNSSVGGRRSRRNRRNKNKNKSRRGRR
jgi:hypothetical protein